MTEERNRTSERNLSGPHTPRPRGSGLLSTFATVVILAGAGMAGASQSNGGHVAEQAKDAITGGPGVPPTGPAGEDGSHEGDGTSTSPGVDGGSTGDHGSGGAGDGWHAGGDAHAGGGPAGGR